MTATAADVIVRDYERLKPGVMRSLKARMTARGIHADDADMEAFYNQAWHGLYTRLAAGDEVANRHGLLLKIAERRAIDEARSLRHDRRAPAEALDEHGVDPDLAARLDDRMRLRQFTEALHDRLSERERQAAMLCYVHEYTRPAAARALGVSPRRMEKIMDSVSKKVGAFVRDIEGGVWCESRRSLIKAYALGLLDANGARHVLAIAHLEDCPACRHRVLRMRGLAALTPPAPALLAAAVGVSGGQAGKRPRGRSVRNATIAAGAAGVLAATALATIRDSDPPPQSERAAAERAPEPAAPTASPPARAAAAPEPTTRRRVATKRRRTKPAKPRATATPAPATPAPTAPPQATAVPARTPIATPGRPPRDYDGAGEFELR